MNLQVDIISVDGYKRSNNSNMTNGPPGRKTCERWPK